MKPEGVGLQGYSQAEVAFQNAATYSKERLQGKNLFGKTNKETPADPIIVHPDIRRSLMDQKVLSKGLALYLLGCSINRRSFTFR